jgi:enterochelin esterase family protein
MRLEVTVPSWARHVVSDRTDMDRAPRPIDPTAVRRFRVPLPDDVYYEYAFLDAEGSMRADPANPERADNPWYPEVSCVRGPAYRAHPLASPESEAARGKLRRLRLPDGAGGVRRVALYEPAGLTGPAPLAIVHDGTAYQRIARLPALLETLVASGRARPARLAFLDPSRPAARRAEYGFGEGYLRELTRELVPRLRDEADAAGGTVWIGASLGGLAALRAAWEAPEATAGLVLQSPALLGAPDERDFHASRRSWWLETLARDERALPWRVAQEVGTFDWLHDVNLGAAAATEPRILGARFVTRSAGHNWTFWRDGLADGVAFVLAPDAR